MNHPRRMMFLTSIVLCASAWVYAQTTRMPVTISSFGGLTVNDQIAPEWKVRSMTVFGREISVTLGNAAAPPLVVVFSLDEGHRGAFDREGVRIYYQRSALPQETSFKIGNALAERVAAYAASRGGLLRHVTATAQGVESSSDEYVSSETARHLLASLEGKWAVTAEKVEGTAQRSRYLNDFILREEGAIGGSRHVVTIGCSPEDARCWVLLLAEKSNRYRGGYGVFSRSGNTLSVMERPGEPTMILRVMNHDLHVLEVYEPGTSRVTKLRYTRIK